MLFKPPRKKKALPPFILEGKPLEWVTEHMYLGILIDNALTLTKHYDYIWKRTVRRRNILRMISGCKWADINTLLLYYKACIRVC